MSPLHASIIAGVGLVAGTMNTVVGSGSLVTFPTLLALGYPSVVANVSNNVGLVPGALSGAFAYRSELRSQRRRVSRLVPASLSGGAIGGALLLILPSRVFDDIVPALIGLAVLLVIIGPRISARLAAKQRRRAREAGDALGDEPIVGPESSVPVGPVLFVFVALTGIYGGYFGAGQGVVLLALLSTSLRDDLQRLNAVKNALAGCANGAAAVVFLASAHVDWAVAGLIAGGSVVGGQVGARIGRRLDPGTLRAVVVVVGLAAMVKLLLR